MSRPSEVSRLLEQFGKRDVRALSRLISYAENQNEQATEALAALFAQVGKARVIGITGPPGAGKSTLTSHFVSQLRAAGKTVAVIAVDPVSPFTGGALLGDRIRLVEHFNDAGVFIRSLSTRGKLGGLSLATRQVLHFADAFGFDYVILETVGVGQSEVDVRKLVDATLVVLVPEWGDAVQTLKAGVLEIGDLFVINKSDRDGADRLLAELKTMLQMANRDATPLLMSTTHEPKTITALMKAIDQFCESQKTLVEERRKTSKTETAHELLENWVLREARRWITENRGLVADVNPYQFFNEFRSSRDKGLFEK